jgi:hypothetical protein
MPDQIWNAGMKVMLLNDTSLSPHVGSLAVSAALERLISLADAEITQRVYVTEQGELWRGAAPVSIRTRGAITDFGRTSEGRRRDFDSFFATHRSTTVGTFHELKRELDQSPFEKRDQPPLPRTNVAWTLHNGAVRRMIRTSAQSDL